MWTSPVISKSGHKYSLLLLDDFTHFTWVYPLKYKSQVFSYFLSFHNYVKTQFEKEIKAFQCDNGLEFKNSPFSKFGDDNGMIFRFSCPYTSSQNGKAECMIRTTNNIVRTLLIHANIPPNFWIHALDMAAYLLNILPTRTLHNKTPMELLFHKIPSYAHLRVFGCLCYPNLSSVSPHKLAPRSTPCVFLGFPTNHRGYKCFDLSTNKFIISRHVTFVETEFPFQQLENFRTANYDFLNSMDQSPLMVHMQAHQNTSLTPTPAQSTNTNNISNPTPSYIPQMSRSPSPSPLPSPPPPLSSPTPPHSSPEQAQKPSNHSNSPKFGSLPPSPIHVPTSTTPSLPRMATRASHGIFKPKPIFNLTAQIPSPLPKNPKLALLDPNWKNAMTDELNALIKQNTWDLVPRPAGVNILRCMFLFKHKYRENGDLERRGKWQIPISGCGL